MWFVNSNEPSVSWHQLPSIYLCRIWKEFMLSVPLFVLWRNNSCYITSNLTYGGSSYKTGVKTTEWTLKFRLRLIFLNSPCCNEYWYILVYGWQCPSAIWSESCVSIDWLHAWPIMYNYMLHIARFLLSIRRSLIWNKVVKLQ